MVRDTLVDMSADISGWRKPVRTITESNDQTGSDVMDDVEIAANHDTDERSSTIDSAAAREHPEVAETVAKIKGLRKTIDNIDGAVIHLLAERFKATSQVGVLKAGAGFAPADYKREDYQIERLQRIAKDAGLDPNIAEMYREFVVTEAKKRHKRIADAGGDPGVLDVFA